MWGLLVDFIIRSHDQKSDFAPHFNYCEPRKAMMILTKLLESCDANNSTRGVIDKKVMMHFILVVIDLRNARVLYVTPLTSLDNDANTNEITVQKG